MVMMLNIFFDQHYMQLVEIKDFQIIDNKLFFDQPEKHKEVYEKLIEMSKNDEYTRGNVLDFSYH